MLAAAVRRKKMSCSGSKLRAPELVKSCYSCQMGYAAYSRRSTEWNPAAVSSRNGSSKSPSSRDIQDEDIDPD